MAFDKFGSKLSHFFAMDVEDEQAEDVAGDEQNVGRTQATPSAPRANKVVAMGAPVTKTAKIVVFEPRIYSDGKEIGTHLLNNKAVVVNFDRIGSEDATRIVDFLTGTVFAISGEIKRIGTKIFLVTPANFEIDGSLAATLGVDADLPTE